MKEAFSILTIVTVLLYAVLSMAHDKVVVIPLNKKLDLEKSCREASATKDNEGKWTFVCDTKTVFISSTESTGNLGGTFGADTQCNALASAAGLKGTFKAWLSDSQDSALSRFNWNPENVYRRTDGTIIANSPDDLLDGSIDVEIDRDENGVLIQNTFSTGVWTGTLSDGTWDIPTLRCDDWSSQAHSNVTYPGSPGRKDNRWTRTTAWIMYCDSYGRIFCFEQ